jgi:hypothetical protein
MTINNASNPKTLIGIQVEPKLKRNNNNNKNKKERKKKKGKGQKANKRDLERGRK